MCAYLDFMEGAYCPGKGQTGTASSKAEFRACNKCITNYLYVQIYLFYGKIFSDRKFLCVSYGIVALMVQGVYGGALTKKLCYCPKFVPGYLVDRYFADNKVGGVDMLEVNTEDRRLFNIFCFKQTDYVKCIMVLWMTLDALLGDNTKQNFKGRYCQSLLKLFTYRQLFGLNFQNHNISTTTTIGPNILYINIQDMGYQVHFLNTTLHSNLT